MLADNELNEITKHKYNHAGSRGSEEGAKIYEVHIQRKSEKIAN